MHAFFIVKSNKTNLNGIDVNAKLGNEVLDITVQNNSTSGKIN